MASDARCVVVAPGSHYTSDGRAAPVDADGALECNDDPGRFAFGDCLDWSSPLTDTKLCDELLADAAAALHRDRCDFRSECRGRTHQHQ
jgi:hypothetical protein